MIDPFLVGSAEVLSGAGTTPTYGCGDYISFIAGCYCYSRGSVRLKIKREYTPTSADEFKYASIQKTTLYITRTDLPPYTNPIFGKQLETAVYDTCVSTRDCITEVHVP